MRCTPGTTGYFLSSFLYTSWNSCSAACVSSNPSIVLPTLLTPYFRIQWASDAVVQASGLPPASGCIITVLPELYVTPRVLSTHRLPLSSTARLSSVAASLRAHTYPSPRFRMVLGLDSHLRLPCIWTNTTSHPVVATSWPQGPPYHAFFPGWYVSPRSNCLYSHSSLRVGLVYFA